MGFHPSWRFARSVKFLSLACLLGTSCDPALSIRQVEPRDNAQRIRVPIEAQAVVQVQAAISFIGGRVYATGVKVTNSTGLPINVNAIMLVANGKTYSSQNKTQGQYPLTIPAGNTEELDVLFELDEDVLRTFKKAAELQVHYQSGGSEQIARATVIGGRLNN
jgi:hypothetical protein